MKFKTSDYVDELYEKYLGMTDYSPDEIRMVMNDLLAEDLETRMASIEHREHQLKGCPHKNQTATSAKTHCNDCGAILKRSW